MKKLFIYFLSICILNLQFATINSYAEDYDEEEIENRAEREINLEDAESASPEDISAMYQGVQWFTLIFIVSTSVAASIMYLITCLNALDTKVFLAGSAYYVFNEISNFVKFTKAKKLSTQRLTAITNTTEEKKSRQIEAITETEATYQAALEAVKSRIKSTTIAAIAWAAAAVIALVIGAAAQVPPTMAGAKPFDACVGYIAPPFDNKNLISDKDSPSTKVKAIDNTCYNNQKESKIKDKLLKIFSNLKLKIPGLLSTAQAEDHEDEEEPENSTNTSSEEVGKNLGIIIPVALAAFAVCFIIIAGIITAGKPSAIIRGVIGFVLATLGAVAIAILVATKNNIEKRLEKLAELRESITAFVTTNASEVSSAVTESSTPTTSSGVATETQEEAPSNNCVDMNSNGVSSSVTCSSCTDGACGKEVTKRHDPNFKQAGGVNLPNSLLSVIDKVNQNVDDVANGNETSAENELTNEDLQAMKKLIAQTKRKLNKVLKEEGKPTINFRKEEDAMISQLFTKTQEAFDSKFSPAEIETIKDSFMSGDFANDEKDKAIDYDSQRLNAKKNTTTIPSLNSSLISFDDDEEDDIDNSGLSNSNEEMIDAASSLNNLNIDNKDIIKNDSASIFKVITIRYRKSGYKKLFGVKKKSKPISKPK